MSTTHVVYRGLKRSGLPWALFPPDKPGPVRHAGGVAAANHSPIQLTPQQALALPSIVVDVDFPRKIY